jgi:group I intron endonuclease
LKSKEGFIITRALVKYGYVNFSISILEYCDKSILIEREQHYLDSLQPKYNILKLAGSSLGYTHTQESKDKRSKALALGSDGVYTGSKSALFGRTHSEETIAKMSLNMRFASGEKNPFYGKLHNDKYIEVMKEKALNRKHTYETKDKLSKSHGEGTSPVNIYEKCSSEDFELIGSFVSARRAAKFLDMSGSTVIRYMNSGHVFKDRYKFSRSAHN